jgi:hypothetical protein
MSDRNTAPLPPPPREIIMDSAHLISPGGVVTAPECCGLPMIYEGDCGIGCCSDYKCRACRRRVRVEWPD